ncbi:hypothetical protein DPMN_006396 [Dreissena polymorpha]|uniref:Uncharacterized protein n=1 Tax=Dreissena polymorpha TaxID=45954 RepID=A0A9D4MTX7_DREPO|nr:hypothetical protein DPMN_006396 [Dreissena polymorpha]
MCRWTKPHFRVGCATFAAWNHITKYKHHVDEAKRAGVVDYSQILRKAEKPVEVDNMKGLDEDDPEKDSEGMFEQY